LNPYIIKAFRLSLWIFLPLSLWLFNSCKETTPKANVTRNLKQLEDSVVAFNHELVRTEMQEIDDYIQRYHWLMKKTHTGLRYMIYKKGQGPVVKAGDYVALKFKINLLNGDLVYVSDSVSLFSFEVGKGSMVSGLEEGVLLMKKGDCAKLIVPSHLAYGFLGDMAKIPTRATLVYDLELCAVNQRKK
jgi:FKBP-type peptidyl-prolyl cis-trans isomerase FkpA